MPVPGYPFAAVRNQPVAEVAPGAAAVDLTLLAYQMMRDAKALPTIKLVCTAGETVPLFNNAQRNTPVFVRIRAALDNSIGTPYLYVGTDMSQTGQGAALDRIGNGGQIEFLLYPGQELHGAYTGDPGSTGDILISTATYDEALLQARRATGQVR